MRLRRKCSDKLVKPRAKRRPNGWWKTEEQSEQDPAAVTVAVKQQKQQKHQSSKSAANLAMTIGHVPRSLGTALVGYLGDSFERHTSVHGSDKLFSDARLFEECAPSCVTASADADDSAGRSRNCI